MATYREPGKFIEVEPGVDLYVEEKGSGTPIIFIPGWTFTTELFDHQMAHFAQNYRAITMIRAVMGVLASRWKAITSPHTAQTSSSSWRHWMPKTRYWWAGHSAR